MDKLFDIRIWDLIDIVIVGYLLYLIYKLLRGSIAFNIFVGVMLLYAVWWLVGVLKMDMLSMVLGQFVSVGVIIIIIIFQPEVRRFLLLLGNTTLKGRTRFFKRLFDQRIAPNLDRQEHIQAIRQALLKLSKHKIGSLVILSGDLNLQSFNPTGVVIDAEISKPLLESIFAKDSPLHDGATIIYRNRIQLASCILPVSDNEELPQNVGLRHRAAVGVTEVANVVAFVTSEENGRISYAVEGKLYHGISSETLTQVLERYY